MAFATAEDVATVIQRDLSAAETATVEFLLELATAVISSYTGQLFVEDTSTVVLTPRRGKIRLPQRPVSAVTSVVSASGFPVFYEFDGVGTITASPILIANGPDEGTLGTSPLTITYTHGYETIPDDIRAVTVQVASRAFGMPPDKAGVQQESLVSYSYSVGAAAAQGPIGLLAGERLVLDRYRLPVSPVAMF